MARGIVYAMASCVEGLVKIGKTNLDGFEQRMAYIERDGYHHISVLKREFAIEVDDYDEKERLLHEIFSKSRVGDSELFAIDINLVKQLMSSLDGKIVYPLNENKKDIFENATEEIEVKQRVIPDGIYTLEMTVQKSKAKAKAKMEVKNGNLILKSDSTICPVYQETYSSWMSARKDLKVENGILKEDFPCTSPSMAAAIVVGHNKNGWEAWKNSDGKPIDIYRRRSGEE